MKILCLSDIHGDTDSLALLHAEIAGADLILAAGDFTDFGGRSEMLRILEHFEAKKPSMAAVGGNCDRMEARRVLETQGLSVDGRPKAFDSGGSRITVIGAGGGLLKTGLTPYERKDADLAAAFEAAMHGMPGPLTGHGDIIAISHNPPFGTEADLRHAAHTGSRGLRDLLDALAPALWVCGHIHEGRSVSRTGKTLVVNPGCLRDGYFAIGLLEAKAAQGIEIQIELRSL